MLTTGHPDQARALLVRTLPDPAVRREFRTSFLQQIFLKDLPHTGF